MELREYLAHKTLLFDGAMGTYFRAVYADEMGKCELANCTAPERVTQVHNAYLECGARAIKTNTFAANTRALECEFNQVREVITQGWRLAVQAAEPYRAFVFADIGPIIDANGEYEQIVEVFLNLGAKNFLFETLSEDSDLYGLAAYIKARCPDVSLSHRLRFLPMDLPERGCRFVRFCSA